MQLLTPARSQAEPHISGSTQNGQPFLNLRAETLAQFNALAMELDYARGAHLFLEGERPKWIYIVVSGRIKLSVTSREGRTAILRIAGAGDVLGMNAVLAGTAHEISAEAVEPSHVKAVRTADFLAFIQKYPEAAMETTRCMMREYQLIFNNICRLALPATVSGRLANLLLEWLHTRRTPAPQQGRVTVTLTHGEIAEMTNTSRETVSRVLTQFQREKLISMKGASLTVLRPQALEQLAT